jgi:cytochrome c553
MRAHFDEVIHVHEAVIRGDLEAARTPARRMAEHLGDEDVPPLGARYVAALDQLAARVVTAPDVESAAAATASMLATCGDCHRATGQVPAPSAVARPPVGGVVGHMLEHQAAADGMFRALVVPSASLWREGVTQLRTAPLRRRDLPNDPKLTPQLLAFETRVHEVAARALEADTATSRATVYAAFIARCAGCHSVHQKLWGPASR